MNEDQELLDRFAIAAMQIVDPNLYVYGRPDPWDTYADECWSLAIEMKKARDRICTTAKPAQMDPGPFPKIDADAIPEKLSAIAAKRLGFEPFELTERN